MNRSVTPFSSFPVEKGKPREGRDGTEEPRAWGAAGLGCEPKSGWSQSLLACPACGG